MNLLKREDGFTLVEVLAVIIIISALATITIPKLVSSTTNARQKADIATAHQVKAALDRYQVENGTYPILTDDDKGSVTTSSAFIHKYISKLDTTTTQQIAKGKEGFGVISVTADETDETLLVFPSDSVQPPTNVIMIYLLDNGLAAEVRAYDQDLGNILWESAN